MTGEHEVNGTRYVRCPECERYVATTSMDNIRPHGIRGVTKRCPGSMVWAPRVEAQDSDDG